MFLGIWQMDRRSEGKIINDNEVGILIYMMKMVKYLKNIILKIILWDLEILLCRRNIIISKWRK